MSALERTYHLADGRTAHVRFTSAAEGDLAVSGSQPELDQRRAGVVPLPWTWLTQVHGGEVVVIDRPGACAGAEADGAVTTVTGAPLAIHTADCAPVAVVARTGAVGAMHVGWRGLVAGIVEHTVDRLRALGADDLVAAIGPCIHAPCYEFGAADLDAVAQRYGDTVRATTAEGRPALDLPAGVRAALGRAGVQLTEGDAAPCTACSDGFFSHRARRDTARQAMVVWLDGA